MALIPQWVVVFGLTFLYALLMGLFIAWVYISLCNILPDYFKWKKRKKKLNEDWKELQKAWNEKAKEQK